MNHSSNNHPPTQPRNGHTGHKVSQRGLLSIAMLILSMGAFGIAAISGAKMVYDVLGGNSKAAVVVVIAQIIVIGLAYAVGWITALVAIRVYGNLILPMLINWCTWGCLLAVCYLYLAILKRMYAQPDDIVKFINIRVIPRPPSHLKSIATGDQTPKAQIIAPGSQQPRRHHWHGQ